MLRAGIELVPAGGAIEALRAVKDADELEAIRAAARLADDALTEVLGRGLVGPHRARGRARPRVHHAPHGGRRPRRSRRSSPPASTARCRTPSRARSPIPAGTLVVVDWGAQLDGYASDCTRTYATGEIDPRDRQVYALVLQAQEAALAAVRPGPTGREVDAVARAIIDAAGHAEHFGHGLGHGVGLDVHEGPRLSKQGETALAAGMVVTVEPGVYVPGAVGVRIEDLVIVTDDGAEVVSSLPKELQFVV